MQLNAEGRDDRSRSMKDELQSSDHVTHKSTNNKRTKFGEYPSRCLTAVCVVLEQFWIQL